MPNYWYDHIHLISPDPKVAARFYEKMFDAKTVKATKFADGRINIALDINGSRILIVEPRVEAQPAPSETGYGMDHFGIHTDNLEAAVAELKAKGVKFRDEIRANSSGMKISFLWGPDNVLIELLERNA